MQYEWRAKSVLLFQRLSTVHILYLLRSTKVLSKFQASSSTGSLPSPARCILCTIICRRAATDGICASLWCTFPVCDGSFCRTSSPIRSMSMAGRYHDESCSLGLGASELTCRETRCKKSRKVGSQCLSQLQSFGK